jgi:diadenosine tetraphosphate (Ap4A) HIT family hydrolase
MDFVVENSFAIAIRDKYPARPLHTLIISKRHIADIFESTAQEREAIHE